MLYGAGAVVLVLVAVFLLRTAGKARAVALGELVHREIEPYLRRMSAEHGLSGTPPTWTRHSPPEEIVAHSAKLAVRLNEHEKTGTARTASDLELARTQQLGE